MLQDVAGVYQKHYIKRFSDVLVRAKVAKWGCLHRTGEGSGGIGMLYHQQEIHTCLTSDWQHSFSSSSVCQVRNLRMPQEVVNQFPNCIPRIDLRPNLPEPKYLSSVDVGSMGKVYNHHPEQFLSLNWKGQFEERPFFTILLW
jgi:hypothetical protein